MNREIHEAHESGNGTGRSLQSTSPAMFPLTFYLIQNEGFLMQGCFKSSLADLRDADNALPGRFYAAFFNYAIGLERLLKIILLLDKWHRERKFLTDDELRKKGHNVEKLYKRVFRKFS